MEGAHVGKPGCWDIFALGQVTPNTMPAQCVKGAGAWTLNRGLE